LRAAVFTALKKIECRDIPQPTVRPGEALIEVHYCGICGSDVAGFQHGDPFAGPYPYVVGHEASGIIVELGSETDRFRVGDKVVYEITLGCGECRPCREGRYEDCQDIKIIGGHLQGAFAEYIKVPYHLIYKLPESMSLKLASVCEPYTIGARACAKGNVGPNDRVLVLGAGNIAFCAAAVAKERGAKTFLAARNQMRLERAKLFGPDAVINTMEENISARLNQLTDGEGCSVIIDCTGARTVVEAAESYAVRSTRLVLVGMSPDSVTIPILNIVLKELQIIGSQNSYGQYPWVIEKLNQNRLCADSFITDVFPLEKMQEAMEYAIENAGKCGKVLIQVK
jgi:L-gulonate 5-dehydrogenase